MAFFVKTLMNASQVLREEVFSIEGVPVGGIGRRLSTLFEVACPFFEPQVLNPYMSHPLVLAPECLRAAVAAEDAHERPHMLRLRMLPKCLLVGEWLMTMWTNEFARCDRL